MEKRKKYFGVILGCICMIYIGMVHANAENFEMEDSGLGANPPIISNLEENYNASYSFSWSEVENADGYEIYCSKDNPNGNYELVQSDWVNYYNTNSLETGHRYFYKVRAYIEVECGNGWEESVTFQKQYGEFSQSIEIEVPLVQAEYLTVTRKSYHSLKLTWNEGVDADGYLVQRSEAEKGIYQTIAKITNKKKNTYIDDGLITGKKYYYRVFLFKGKDFSEIYPSNVIIQSGVPKLDSTKKITSKCNSPKILNLSWQSVEAADGYVVYKTDANQKNWKKYKDLSGKNNTKIKFGVSNGKKYRIRIIAYKKLNGQEIEGVKKEKVVYGDYYGYKMENEVSKNHRIYHSKFNKEYKKKKEAMKHMTTINVKVWDFANGMSGKKVTKVKSFTCNKEAAPTLKQVFKKIYKGKEKAPIYEIGGFRWRKEKQGQHEQGLALDLNAKYNAMYINKKLTVGSCWNPKKYAYSIKRHGDIENAFEEYGFKRGFWDGKEDYMHFSYYNL